MSLPQGFAFASGSCPPTVFLNPAQQTESSGEKALGEQPAARARSDSSGTRSWPLGASRRPGCVGLGEILYPWGPPYMTIGSNEPKTAYY
jgi:hypothetical protein